MNSLWLAFLTGLTTGGLSCIAVQGGLLTSALATDGQEAIDAPSVSSFRRHWMFIVTFLTVKVIAYTIVGGLLGAIGGFFTVSLKAQGLLQIIVGLFMFATAARILNLHPIFRYFVIAPPKFIYKFLRRFTKEGHLLTPALLGGFTIFMPCGVTQVMMAGAVATGSPVMGALLLGSFTLGTSPVFFLLGLAAGQLFARPIFSYVASAIILYFGFTSINGGLILAGSPYTAENFYKAATMDVTPRANTLNPIVGDRQEVTMFVSAHAYEPDVKTLKLGVPVKLTLKTDNAQGCIRAFTIPTLNLTKILPETGEEIIEFTPNTPGKLSYSCNMGMYSGTFDVVM